MTIYNQGTITFNKEVTEKAKKIISSILKNDNLEIDEWDTLEIGCYASDFDGYLNEIISKLSPLGYVLNGEIEYSGDYEGKIYVNNNHVESLDIAETSLYEASTEELIKKLTERGLYVENIVRTAIRKSKEPYTGETECEELFEFSVCIEYFRGIVEYYIEENNLQAEYDLDKDFENLCDIDAVSFIVPKVWLLDHLKQEGIKDAVNYLLNEYTSDDSIEWYEAANKAGMIYAVVF